MKGLKCKQKGQNSEQRSTRLLGVSEAGDEGYSKDFLVGWEQQQDFFIGWAEAEKEYSRDLMLAYRRICDGVEADLGYEASAMFTPGGKPAVPQVDPYDISARRAMDQLLRKCFLQAAQTDQITRQLRAGMPSKASRIYAECMRPCRPLGTSIDVKVSSYCCLKGLFEDLEAQGLLELAYSAPDPVVSKFFWDHPDIINFEPWPAEATVLGASEEHPPSSTSKPRSSVETSSHTWHKPSSTCRSTTSRSAWKGQQAETSSTALSGEDFAEARYKVCCGTGRVDGLKDNGTWMSSTQDVIRRVPSPSKAKVKRQQ